MTEQDIEIILQRVHVKFSEAKPRIISDNGPQSNGKLERYHKPIKAKCIRPKAALSLEDARDQIDSYIQHYVTVGSRKNIYL